MSSVAQKTYLKPGTLTNGYFETNLYFSSYIEAGIWTLSVELQDLRPNTRIYGASDLSSLGYSSTVQVYSNEDTEGPVVQSFDVFPKVINSTTQDVNVLLL